MVNLNYDYMYRIEPPSYSENDKLDKLRILKIYMKPLENLFELKRYLTINAMHVIKK